MIKIKNRNSDNFPTINVEALVCGTPVITLNTGESPESIDEKTGIITKEKSSKSIYEAIKEIKKGLFSIEMCRKRSMKYSAEAMNRDYLRLYNSHI